MEINLKLSVPEINLVLACLARAPYQDVFELIEKVQAQAKPQAEALE